MLNNMYYELLLDVFHGGLVDNDLVGFENKCEKFYKLGLINTDELNEIKNLIKNKQ